MELKTPQTIDKADVGSLTFSSREVLPNTVDHNIRLHNLHRALKLGNIYKRSVTIQFVTEDFKQLETVGTIWAVTQQYIMLKGHATVPIRAITNVIL